MKAGLVSNYNFNLCLAIKLKQNPHPKIPMRVVQTQTRTRITRRTGTVQGYAEDLGNGVKLMMVLIPKGHFTMGSPP